MINTQSSNNVNTRNVEPLDVTTLTTFDLEPAAEQDNETVLSKIFQRVKSSFSVITPPIATTSSTLVTGEQNNTASTTSAESKGINASLPTSSMPEKDKGSVQDASPNVSLSDDVTVSSDSAKFDNPTVQVTMAKEKEDAAATKSAPITTPESSNSVSDSKVIRRLRGEGITKDYWMADDTCKECYICKVNFTTWRRKHHCRTCGLIFCSKCASNIISGEKYGHDGQMRVCDLCLSLMKEHGDYDENDNGDCKRVYYEKYDPAVYKSSPASSLQDGFHTAPYTSADANKSTSSLMHPLQNIIPRAPSPDTISINDGFRKILTAGSSLFTTRSRSNTASDEQYMGLAPSLDPFRRNLAEEDEVVPAVNPETGLDPELASDEDSEDQYDSWNNPSLTNFLTTLPYGCGDTLESTTTTPAVSEYAGSDDEVWSFNTRQSQSRLHQKSSREDGFRTHFRDRSASSRRRSITSNRPVLHARRGLKRQINSNVGQQIDAQLGSSPIEPRSVSPFPIKHHRSSSAPVKVEINPVFLQHMSRLLRQSLIEAKIDLSEGWEDVIMKLMLKVSDYISTDIRNGDEIDIRHYVKTKRIPGGTPQDSEYVQGVVCTKNVAHKKMPRRLVNPQILILTFALEYHRVEDEFMSLEPVIQQEEEYLQNLVQRIVDLGPDLILVEKSVARKALQFLLDRKVTVVINVKPTVIEAVARCTRACIISSIDQLAQLASEPRVTKCGEFSVRTYVHELLPGHRKTYLVFDKCPKELGCTLILRGEDIKKLEKIKLITYLMTHVAYNLKLETALMTNQNARVPSMFVDDGDEKDADKTNAANSDAEKSETTDKRLVTFESTLFSASPFVKFPLPYLLIRVRQAERKLTELSAARNQTFKDSEKQHYSTIGSTSSMHSGISYLPEQVITENELKDACNENNLRTRAWSRFLNSYEHVTPFSHQNIVVLYSNVCNVTQLSCQGPLIRVLEYYRETDITLGQYLEETYTEASILCPVKSCDRPLLLHHRNYCHGFAKITVSVIDECPIRDIENTIMMWNYCKKCKRATQAIPMSDDTWKYSFGKYLELSFYQTELRSRVEGCPHSIYRDHRRFFGFNNLTVCFEYHSIDLMEIYSPPMTLYIKPEVHIRLKKRDVDTIRQKIIGYWDSVSDRIKNFNEDAVQKEKLEACKQELLEMLRRVATEKKYMLHLLQQTYKNSGPTDILALNFVLTTLQEKVVAWEQNFSEIVRQYLRPRLTAVQLRRFLGEDKYNMAPEQGSSVSRFYDLPLVNMDYDDDPSIKSDEQPVPSILPKLGTSPNSEHEWKDGDIRNDDEIESLEIDMEKAHSQSVFMDPKISRRLSMKWMKAERPSRLQRPPSEALFSPIMNKGNPFQQESEDIVPPRIEPTTIKHKNKPSELKDPATDSYGSRHRASSGFARALQGSNSSNFSSSSRPSRLHFVFEKKEIDEKQPEQGSRKHKQKAANNSDNEKHSSRLGGKSARTDLANTDEPARRSLVQKIENKGRKLFRKGTEEFYSVLRQVPTDELYIDYSASTFLGQDYDDAPAPEFERAAADGGSAQPRVAFVRSLANLLADRGANALKPLDYPLQSTEHVFPDSKVIVREDEPSSIIAFTLSSKDYLEKLHSVQKTQPSTTSSERFMPGDELKSGSQGSDWGILDVDAGDALLRETGSHIKYQVQEGSTKLLCKIFFAEQFDALRRNCECDETYVQSLARCVKWDSSGGKSGSAFLKTRDDRLVMKQMSRLEFDAFLKFAPTYFNYMHKAFYQELPTVLAKIFGFYRIGYKNEHLGKSIKIDVIVMENLFYERKISKIFDLKGSMRNRHVQSTGKENEVLLDENLLELLNDQPLFLHEHSKAALYVSLWNDTLFLSQQNVMDYSLLVGIDEENQELVVGIVDFIRQFTWDKRLESWVKETGFLGGGGKEPTIVSPRQYKRRFREAMDRYFLMVPDVWFTFKDYRKNRSRGIERASE
ncbi:4921_t:CDS:2 [Paraglomus brasilianum]|uniref:1-phosphatidylinositol-3-phosphate 5-kinase n=1 Tax=Paraglomus brasilianum TaxID=144538 RepID=A0A9N9CGV2_9GLOM|nr:4921_t:CDS:2 [Paraglomus brasilianum]